MPAEEGDGMGRVIAVATLKGGSGKSTVAGCLAVHWRLQGRTPALLDADPQRSLLRLAERERRLGGVAVFAPEGDELGEEARRLAAGHDLAIVDTPGFENEQTSAAIAAADLVILPVKASPLDVDVMGDTMETLFRLRGGERPGFRCLLTQTTRDSVIARHVRGELAAAGFPLLQAELTSRVIYAEAALFGATPSLLQPRGAAAAEIAALAAELDALLPGLAPAPARGPARKRR